MKHLIISAEYSLVRCEYIITKSYPDGTTTQYSTTLTTKEEREEMDNYTTEDWKDYLRTSQDYYAI